MRVMVPELAERHARKVARGWRGNKVTADCGLRIAEATAGTALLRIAEADPAGLCQSQGSSLRNPQSEPLGPLLASALYAG